MPYETDPDVLAWFERSLADRRITVRRRTLEMLEHVDSALREAWLQAAERDSNARVVATAVLIRIAIEADTDASLFELLESDFGDGELDADLGWEWEYVVKVCEGERVPSATRLVWCAVEDDGAARALALMQARSGGATLHDPVCVILAKRLVTRYTRAPRGAREAEKWRAGGRPRYDEHPEQ